VIVPQLAVETYSSQVFWILIGFVILYLYVANVVTPKIEETFEDRISHIDDLIKNAKKLEAEAQKLERDAFIALENAEIDSAAAESRLMSSFREQSIAEKSKLYERFSRKSKEESIELSRTVDKLFLEISENMDDIMNVAMNSIACSAQSSRSLQSSSKSKSRGTKRPKSPARNGKIDNQDGEKT
jgi:F-type H+-transporting ATPase subunit b